MVFLLFSVPHLCLWEHCPCSPWEVHWLSLELLLCSISELSCGRWSSLLLLGSVWTLLISLQCCESWILWGIAPDSRLLAPSPPGQHHLQLWEIHVFQFRPPKANVCLRRIFTLICETNVNDLFIIIYVPPLSGPAVFWWIISQNSYYMSRIAPWNVFLLSVTYVASVLILRLRRTALKFIPGCLSVDLL